MIIKTPPFAPAPSSTPSVAPGAEPRPSAEVLAGLSHPNKDTGTRSVGSLEEQPREVRSALDVIQDLDTRALPSFFAFLQRYQDQLGERKEILASPIEVRRRVYEADTTQTAEGTFDRLAQCGPFLKGISPDLAASIRAGECKKLDGFPVVHGIPLAVRLMGGNEATVQGATTHGRRAIYHTAPFPSLAETLHHVAQHGALPDVITTIAHEQTHLRQETHGRYLARLGTFIAAGTSLIGSVAVFSLTSTLAMVSSVALFCVPIVLSYAKFLSPFNKALEEACAGVFEKSLYAIKDPHTALVGEQQRLKDVTPENCKQVVRRCAQVIRELLLLTDDEQAIASIVKSASYDSRVAGFPKLEVALANVRRNLDLRDEDVYQQVMNALEARDTIERAVYQKEARAIAMNYVDRPS